MKIEEQEIIRFIKEFRGKGLTYIAVCRELTKHGYQPLGNY